MGMLAARAAREAAMLDTLLRDLKFGLRTLQQAPTFTLLAVLTLALGIGANSAIFSLVNAVLLHPLPYAQPDRLVSLDSSSGGKIRSEVSYPNFLDWARDHHALAALAAYRPYDFDLTGRGLPERVPAEMISANFFSLLGVQPVAGRWFNPAEDRPGAAPVALIGDGLAQRDFGAASNALGQQLTLSGINYTVIGVVPSSFRYADGSFHRSDVYVPIGQSIDPVFRDRRESMGMRVIGRLQPGVSLRQAQAEMSAVARRLAATYPEADRDSGIRLLPLQQSLAGDVQPYLLLLLGAVGCVLLIACVNVANLLLTRSLNRAHEVSVRLALGATQGRVLRQLLTESLLLSLGGGSLGLVLAFWGLMGAVHLLPADLARITHVALDGPVVLFTLALSLLAGVLFGLAPALRAARLDLRSTLAEAGRGTIHARSRLQGVFVAAEMALAILLLTGAGLMIRTMIRLAHVDPGFDSHHVLASQLSFPLTGHPDPDAIRATLRRIQDVLNAVPGVQGASLMAASVPLRQESALPYWIDGQTKPVTQSAMRQAMLYLVQPGYRNVMGIRQERGRFLLAQDNEQTPVVTVVDTRFARLNFPGQNPIGQRIHISPLNLTAQIVGVVDHVRQSGLAEDANEAARGQFYLSIAQLPDAMVSAFRGNTALVLRTASVAPAQINSIRSALRQINSNAVLYDTETMDRIFSRALAARRSTMALLSIFAGFALVLACIGIYAVISFATSQRTQEIGIRMALGATWQRVLAMILGDGLKLALLGMAIGIAASLALTRFLGSLLYGVHPIDPWTLLVSAFVLLTAALAGCALPARRAARLDPAKALRHS